MYHKLDVFCFFCALFSCVVCQCAIPIPATDRFPVGNYMQQINNTLDEITSEIQNLFNISSVVGLHVTIVYDQDVIYEKGFGCARGCIAGNPELPKATDIFRVGSFTKVFTNMMLLMMRDAGLVSLDTQVTDLLPNLNMPNPFPVNNRGITLKMLGSHTSGLQGWGPCHSPCNITTAEMVERLNSIPVIYPPLRYVHYSNLGLALLGRALETVTPDEQSYEDYVTQNVLQKLGMNQSGFDITRETRSQMAVGYNVVDGHLIPTEELPALGWMAPAGQMHSSPSDLAQFVKMLFRDEASNNGTQPLDGTTISEWMNMILFQNTIPTRPTSFGLPWENEIINDKYLVRTKNGAIAGYAAEIYLSPERKLAVIANVNQQPSSHLEVSVCTLAMQKLLPLFESLSIQYNLAAGVPSNYQNLLGNYGFEGVVKYSVQYVIVPNYQNSFQLVLVENGEAAWVLEDTDYLFPGSPYEYYTRILPVSNAPSCWVFEGGQPAMEFAVFTLDASGVATAITMPYNNGKHFAAQKIK